MKRKMITSLILTIFLAVMVLCFAHTAMMASMSSDDCVLSTGQSMCPLRLADSWGDLFMAWTKFGSAISLLFLASLVLFVLFFACQIKNEYALQSTQLYSKTYPNFSSLNFLSYALRTGILNPKVF